VISLAVAAAGWVGSSHPEITPTSNSHHLRNTTADWAVRTAAANSRFDALNALSAPNIPLCGRLSG